MNKAEKQVIKLQLDKEQQTINDLEKQYKKALRDIEDRIRMLQSDELTQSRIYQIQYQKALRGQVEGILDKLHGDEYATIQQYLHDSYQDGFIGTMYSIHGQGIPLILPIDQDAAVKAVITDSQIKEGLYKGIGVNIQQLKQAIRQEITRGIASNMPFADIARNIANRSKAPLSRAKTIVRTEGHRIQQASANDARDAAKANGCDVVKQWDGTLDGDTRPTHRRLDGQIRETNEPFEMDGKTAMYPGDFGKAEEDCNCRCVALTRAKWALDEDELKVLKERAAYYKLNKEKQFKEFEEKYLGITEKKGNTVFEFGTLPKELADSYRKTYEMLAEMYPLDNIPVEFVGDFRVVRGYDMDADFIDLLDDLYAQQGVSWYGIGGQYMPPGMNLLPNKGAFIELVDPEITVRTKEEAFRLFARIRKETGWNSPANSFYNMTMGSETVMIHEYGHALANNYGLYKSQKTAQPLIDLFKSYSADEIGKQVSKYAATDWDELFAECFVQSFDPEHQSDISKEVMKILDQRIKETKGKTAIKAFKSTAETLKKQEKRGIIKLGNKEVRTWYIDQVRSIPDSIDQGLPMAEKARLAFEERNRIRTEARNRMADEATREMLDREKPNKTFEELVKSKMERKGMTRDEAIEDVYKTATKTNANVNRELGMEDD